MTRRGEFDAHRYLRETRITLKSYPRVRDYRCQWAILGAVVVVLAVWGFVQWAWPVRASNRVIGQDNGRE